MRTVLALVIFLAGASGALAQSTELKKSGARILGVVFSELEKQTIRTLFGSETERQTRRQTGRYDEGAERRHQSRRDSRRAARTKGAVAPKVKAREKAGRRASPAISKSIVNCRRAWKRSDCRATLKRNFHRHGKAPNGWWPATMLS